jgi:hypothetical protein
MNHLSICGLCVFVTPSQFTWRDVTSFNCCWHSSLIFRLPPPPPSPPPPRPRRSSSSSPRYVSAIRLRMNHLSICGLFVFLTASHIKRCDVTSLTCCWHSSLMFQIVAASSLSFSSQTPQQQQQQPEVRVGKTFANESFVYVWTICISYSVTFHLA